jgi:hypothetical protein
MKFSNLSDFQSRYCGVFVLFEGEPVYVQDVSWRNEDLEEVCFHTMNDNSDSKVFYPFREDCDVVLDADHSFYIKANNSLYYMSRTARKRWKQGFCHDSYTGMCLDRGLRTPARQPDSGWSLARNFFTQDFTEERTLGRDTILSHEVAYDKHGHLYVKGRPVGNIYLGDDGLVAKIFPEFLRLSRCLRTVGLEVEAHRRTRSELARTFTVADLDRLGVEETLIQEILSSFSNQTEDTSAGRGEPRSSHLRRDPFSVNTNPIIWEMQNARPT